MVTTTTTGSSSRVQAFLEDDFPQVDELADAVGPSLALSTNERGFAGRGPGPSRGGVSQQTPDTIITASGREIAAAVGITLPSKGGRSGHCPGRDDCDPRDLQPLVAPGPRGSRGGAEPCPGPGGLPERVGFGTVAMTVMPPPHKRSEYPTRTSGSSGVGSGDAGHISPYRATRLQGWRPPFLHCFTRVHIPTLCPACNPCLPSFIP